MRRRDFIAAIGSVAVWPIAVRAQQRRRAPVIGYMGGGPTYTAAFGRGLAEQGYVEGQNVDILYRGASFQYDRFPSLAEDLVRRRVAAIFANSAAALAAKRATMTIPIVFSTSSDPVELGLVASLNRPGGNITGVTWLAQELTAKRLELLHETVPAASLIGLVVNSTSGLAEAEIREAEAAARVLGVRLVMRKASTESEIEMAFAILAEQRVGALLTGSDPLFQEQSAKMVALAARYAVAVIYPGREFVEAGGLMSYGPDASDATRISGTYVGRILKGEKPSDLPVQRSTRIEMLLNLKTAKALGIDPVPTATLLRATEVIE